MNTKQSRKKEGILAKGLRYSAFTMLLAGVITFHSEEFLHLLPQSYDIEKILYQKTTLEEINTYFNQYKEQPVMVTVIPDKCWHTHTDKPAILQGSGITAAETIVFYSDPTKTVQLQVYFSAYWNDPMYATYAQTLKKLCERKVPLTIRGYVELTKMTFNEDDATNGERETIDKRKVQLSLRGQDITYTENEQTRRLSIASDSDSISKAILHLNPEKNYEKLR